MYAPTCTTREALMILNLWYRTTARLLSEPARRKELLSLLDWVHTDEAKRVCDLIGLNHEILLRRTTQALRNLRDNIYGQ